MTRIAYVNGRFQPIARAALPVEDRATQLADGVYEVIKAVRGQPQDLDRHLDRLDRSLATLRIRPGLSRAALTIVIREVLRRNRLQDAAIYIQVDRGTAPRNHLFPKRGRANVIVTARRAVWPRAGEIEDGVGVVTLPDQRWARCDIKSVALLPNLLAKQQAAEAGCREAWLLDAHGRITEGASSNAWIVDRDGRLITPPLSPAILGGVTRSVVLELAREAGLEVVLRHFSLEEARAAREAFLTSTTSLVLPVTSIDGQPVANGKPGSITRSLLATYLQRIGLVLARSG
jgi:D-alanine transaminase